MLVRLILDNLYSFGKQTEFNTISGSPKSLSHHAYPQTGGFKTLKLSAVYGANAAGKSNLISALALLQRMIVDNVSGSIAHANKFKLERSDGLTEQLLAVEFVKDGQEFLYAVKLNSGIISVEELYITSKNSELLVYERKTDQENNTSIRFSDELETRPEISLMKDVLLKQFLKPDQLVFKLLAERKNPLLSDVSSAYDWFGTDLVVLTPDSRPSALAQRMVLEETLGVFLKEMIRAFHVGIESLEPHRVEMDSFFGESTGGKANAQKWKNELSSSPGKVIQMNELGTSRELLFVAEDGKFWVKTLRFNHKAGESDNLVPFELTEESDGTVKLLHLLPAFYDIMNRREVYVIDEIERSIHPSLIKELIRKYSHDNTSQGQLIFTTHESVLLDQDIFRQDEIWFAEKDGNGCTDLYSLSDYREHKTIDIRKGYLEGRYGAIPFLGNLQDLNWRSNGDSR